MESILTDTQFWFFILLIILSFIIFKLIHTSLKKQTQNLENPQKNFEEDLKKWVDMGLMRGNKASVYIGILIPVFLMAIGIIGLTITFLKY